MAFLFHGSAHYNVGIGRCGSSLRKIQEARRQAEVHEFVAALPAGYDAIVGERRYKFTGGRRQSLRIAREILKHPPMLALHEATS